MLCLPIPPAFDPHMAPFRSMFGPFLDKCVRCFFNLRVRCETHANINIYTVSATSEILENSLFGSLWGSFFCSFLGPHFEKASGAHFNDFGSLLGSQSVPKGRAKFLWSGPSVACSRVFVVTEGTFFFLYQRISRIVGFPFSENSSTVFYFPSEDAAKSDSE